MRWNPDDYAKNSDAQLAWARELLERLPLRSTDRVLDVGCGDGKITAEFARAVPQGYVLGIDSSEEFIAYSSSHYPSSQFPNLAFQLMDARHLIAEGSFDLIFSNATLHWVDDQPAFLRGCSRLLRPGGRLIVSCGGKGNASEVVRILDQLIASKAWHPSFAGFSFPYYFHAPDEYRNWLAEAGLSPTHLALVEKDMTQRGPEGLAGWVRTTWMPYTERIPPTDRETFINQLVQCYLQEHPLDDSGLSHVRMVRLEVEASHGGGA